MSPEFRLIIWPTAESEFPHFCQELTPFDGVLLTCATSNLGDEMENKEISRRRALGLFAAATAGPIIATPANAGFLDDLIKILGSGSSGGQRESSPSRNTSTRFDASDGVREALRIASTRAIERVGRVDGYFLDRKIHINLPQSLQDVQSVMDKFGMAGQLDELELRLNRAAETAAPRAKVIFIDAIRTMSIQDAIDIVQGPDDSATRYFKKRMTPPLTTAFKPVVVSELNASGAMTTFDAMARRYSNIPFIPDIDKRARTELVDHGLKYALRGLFHYLGKEEAAIRNDPAKRTTDILKDVFGI